jgi:Fe-S cluster biosynthesis and repair protein YggX
MEGNEIPASELRKEDFAKHYQDLSSKKWDEWIEAVTPHINGRDPETLTCKDLRIINEELDKKYRFVPGFNKAHNLNPTRNIFLGGRMFDEKFYPVKKEDFIHQNDKYVPAYAIISEGKYYAGESYFGFKNNDEFYDFFWEQIEKAPEGTMAVLVDLHS